MAAVTGSVANVQSAAQFDEATARESTLSVTFFWAEFHEACRPNGQLDVVVRQLATLHPRIRFLKVAAEELPELSERFQIAVVPTFVVAQGRAVLDKLEGANVAELAKRVDVLSKSVAKSSAGSGSGSSSAPAAEDAPKPLDEALQYRLKKLISASPVMLFMKGTPAEPKCGFSKKTVQLLRDHQIGFSSFDILSDEQVRQGLKKFSNWPTYPQLYVKGKLIGGLDILNEMAEDGDLSEQLGVEKKAKKEGNKYEQLINRARVMIFIKGSPQQPQCGFSRKLVEILDSEGFKYDYFDILTDDSVRQGLKKYSNWPTFPQLYVNGELIGGLDIVQQLQEDGELAELKE